MTAHRRAIPRLLLAALLASTALLVAPGPVTAQGATTDYLEDFDSDVSLFAPEGDFYTHASGGSGSQTSRVAQAIGHSGTKSWERASTAENTAALDLNFNLCDGVESWTFWVRWSGFAGTTNQLLGMAETVSTFTGPIANGGEAIGLSTLQTSGSVRITAASTTATQTTTLGTAVVDTWYDFTFTDLDCATAEFSVVSQALGNSLLFDIGGSFTNLGFFEIGDSDNTAGVDFSSTVYVDDLTFNDIPAPPPAVGATATVAVTGLVGFDVDANGQTVLARTDSGDFVRSYTGATLAAQGAAVETDCGQPDGVSSYGTHITYYDCDGGTNLVDAIEIRSGSFGTPSKPPVCDDAGFCLQTLPDEELAGVQDDDIGLAAIQEFPIDYSEFEDGTFDEDAIFMAFAFTSLQGNVGVITYVHINNRDDSSDIVFESVGGGQAPDTLCTALGSDGNTYLYASSTESNVVGFRVDFARDEDAAPQLTNLVPSMTQVFSGTASTAAPEGVACAGDRFAILNNDRMTVWERGISQPILSLPATDGEDRSIALSGDEEWVAWGDDGQVYVAAVDSNQSLGADNKAAGEIVTQFTPAAGSLQGIQLHGSGSSMWVATSTSISVYGNLYTVTTGNDTTYCAPPCLTAPPEDEDDDEVGNIGFLGNNEADVEAALEVFTDVGFVFTQMVLGLVPLWVLLVGALVLVSVVVLKFGKG